MKLKIGLFFAILYTAIAITAVATSAVKVGIEFSGSGDFNAVELYMNSDPVCTVPKQQVEDMGDSYSYYFECAFMHPGFKTNDYTLSMVRLDGARSPQSPVYPFTVEDSGPVIKGVIEINGPVVININP